MRVTSMVAGLALVLAACGGSENAGNQATTSDTAGGAAPAAAPAATGTTHNVDMVLADGQYRFVPAELTVKVGIPLVGGKIEELIAGLLVKALNAEHKVGEKWLAGEWEPRA